MIGLCTFVCMYSTKDERSTVHGISQRKSALMIYDKHLELGSKFYKLFWARRSYAVTAGNITEEAIKKYIQEQSEKSRKEDNPEVSFKRLPVKGLVISCL